MENKQVVFEQIQLLREYEHIQRVEELSKDTYRLWYRPSETDSVYKEKVFQLELSLPTNYPITPPIIRFIDKIYHLNIDPGRGLVNMELLQNQWSPFLTLTSVIQSLDRLLEEPDSKYPGNTDLLSLFLSDKSQYLKRVLKSLQNQEPCQIHEMQEIPFEQAKSEEDLDKSFREKIQVIEEICEEPPSHKLNYSSEKKKQSKRVNLASSTPSNFKLEENKTFKQEKNVKFSATGSIDKNQISQSFSALSATLEKVQQSIRVLTRSINSNEELIRQTRNSEAMELLKDKNKKSVLRLKKFIKKAEEIQSQLQNLIEGAKYDL